MTWKPDPEPIYKACRRWHQSNKRQPDHLRYGNDAVWEIGPLSLSVYQDSGTYQGEALFTYTITMEDLRIFRVHRTVNGGYIWFVAEPDMEQYAEIRLCI